MEILHDTEASSEKKETFSENSRLNKEYQTLKNTEAGKERLNVYNYIMDVIRHSKGKRITNEIKYRVTEGENLNQVFLEVLERDSDLMEKLLFMRNTISGYIEEDRLYERFLP